MVIIECISWLIKVTDNNDARRKPEIYSKQSGILVSQTAKTISISKFVKYDVMEEINYKQYLTMQN